MSGPYDDIISLPHPTSSRHPRMPISDRAAQFSPTWFRPDEKKDGGQYITTTGRLRRIDEFNQVLILVDDIKIPLTHVVDLDSEKLPDMNQMEW